MSFKYVFALSIIFTLGACSFKKDPEDKAANSNKSNSDVIETISKEQDKQAAEGILTEKNVSVDFEETQTPHLYKLNVAWPSSVRKIQLQVNEKNENIIFNNNSYTEVVEDNKTYSIKIKSLDQFGSPISALEILKKSPVDISITEDHNLRSDTIFDVNRFFFYNNAKIITNGYGLSIITNKIIIETEDLNGLQESPFWKRSHILTHLPNSSAKNLGELLGSNISITAKKASGLLRVALIGVDGQNGKSGDEITREKGLNTEIADTSLNGRNGTPGATQLKHKNCPRHGNMDIVCEPFISVCSTPPTAGSPGKNGAPGIAGENAWPGGNTGNLVMMIEDSSDFKLAVGKRRGRPGVPGKGGTGFIGGIAGKSGAAPEPCSAPRPAANGNRGARGADGAEADYGKDATISTGSFKIEIQEI